MHLVQVCNVGEICGGTAACAWTIAQAFPDWERTVLFLSPPGVETVSVFAGVKVRHVHCISDSLLQELNADMCLLHNVAAGRVQGTLRSCLSVQYLHSQGARAAADVTVACSSWLANRHPDRPPVLYQPVPIPPQSGENSSRSLESELVIGRLCTPQRRKWPDSIVGFYADLAGRVPGVRWEFVGAPSQLEPLLRQVCQRVRFWPANWNARAHVWRWHGLLYHHPELTESFGRTAAEAMRAGCIPIVDAKGGFVEQVRDGETGFLCHNDTDFVAALQRLRQPGERFPMSHAARQRAGAMFSLRQFRESLGRLLMESDARSRAG